MRKLLLATAAAAALVAAVPASAQVYLGVDPDGTGVQIGPRAGWGDYRRGDYYAYGDDCQVVRERVITPSGREIFRTHRVCD